jgi:Ca2+-binding RTX toxin-like protein
MTQITVTPTFIGTFSETNFYKIDLSTAGLSNIRSIQVRDDGVVGGPGQTINGAGSGASSGFDLDFIQLTNSTSNDPFTAATAPTVPVFNYSTGVTFHPGMLTTYVAGSPNAFQPTINSAGTLLGTQGANLYSLAQSTINSPDGFINGANGVATRLALGEGGSITFALTSPVSTGSLLIGDVLDFPMTFGGDGVVVILSDQPTIAQDTGLTLTASPGGGVMDLTSATNLAQGAGADTLTGGTGLDTISGGGGGDYIRGLDGDDRINGNGGDDDVNGNMGQDTVHGDDGADTVRGGQNNDVVYGDAGDDGHVNGNIGEDTVYGGDGNDTVYGGQGADMLYGENGLDALSGDLGNDTMTGGAGADRFLFRVGSGADVVTDFAKTSGDRIELAAGTSYVLTTSGAGWAVINLGGDSLTLTGVTSAELSNPNEWLLFV